MMDKNELRIALVLCQLSKSNQYGAELLENVSKMTEGTLEIKSAQLYSLMKGLSSSGLVQSYWEDSAIGGKRHYYKLTERGKTALSQYPSQQELVKGLIADKYSNLKNIDFESKQIDNASNYDINVENTKLAMDTPTVSKSEQTFLSSKANEKINIRLDKKVFETLAGETAEDSEIVYTMNNKINNVERRDYKDYSTDSEMLARKKLFDRISCKSIVSFAIQAFVIALCLGLTRKYTDKILINISLIVSALLSIIYIYVFISHYKTLRYTILDGKYEFSIKKSILRGLVMSAISFAIQAIVVLICNVTGLTDMNYFLLLYMLALSLLPTINAILNAICIRNEKID